MSQLFQFDPNQFTITVNGLLINGFADGTFCNIEYTSDIWVMTPGVKNVVRVKQNDDSASVTLTLQKGSAGNKILDDLRLVDLASAGGIFNFLAKDTLNPGNFYSAKTMWVRRTPTFAPSKDAPTQEWILDTNELIANIPGGVVL